MKKSQMRSIPACTGEPTIRHVGRAADTVYPRVYGGTTVADFKTRFPEGLSPRVRGNPARYSWELILHRSIPACTGEPQKEDVSMLAKLTSKNQLTLPKALVSAFQGTEYFDVTHENGRLVLTPVRLTRATAVRAKLAELGLSETDVAEAVTWARQAQ